MLFWLRAYHKRSPGLRPGLKLWGGKNVYGLLQAEIRGRTNRLLGLKFSIPDLSISFLITASSAATEDGRCNPPEISGIYAVALYFSATRGTVGVVPHGKT